MSPCKTLAYLRHAGQQGLTSSLVAIPLINSTSFMVTTGFM